MQPPSTVQGDVIAPQQMDEMDQRDYSRLESLHEQSIGLRGFDMTSAAQTELGGDDGPIDSPDPPTNEVDPEKATAGNAYLGRYPPRADEGHIFSCVLKDPWHLMNQISIPANNGLCHRFAIRWRDILFVPDAQDKAQIEIYVAKKGKL